jgi:hypothetical protein
MSAIGPAAKAVSCEASADRGSLLPKSSLHQTLEFGKSAVFVEVSLGLVCVGLVVLVYKMPGYKMAVLDLFFLPIALAGFSLGRYRAGVMALFCALGTSVVASMNLDDFTWVVSTPVAVLSLTVWAAVLGLSAILIGTIGDDRKRALDELHEAYVGVLEVLSQYLQGANPRAKARAVCVAELAQQVAVRMRLSPSEVDDVRVASLLYDIGSVEITTKVMRRAIDTLEGEMVPSQSSTFRGLDLMMSLGSVLRGAIPLMLCQSQGGAPMTSTRAASVKIPLGAEIIRATRAYYNLVGLDGNEPRLSPSEATQSLRDCSVTSYNPAVLEALEGVAVR